MRINLKLSGWAPTPRQQQVSLSLLLLVALGGVVVSLLPPSPAVAGIVPVLACTLLVATLLFLSRWLEGFLVSMAALATVLLLAALVSG